MFLYPLLCYNEQYEEERFLLFSELPDYETIISVDAEPNGVGGNTCERYAEIGALGIVLGHAALIMIEGEAKRGGAIGIVHKGIAPTT